MSGSEPYEPDNLLDRLSRRETLEFYYRHALRREREILARRLPGSGARVLSVGAGWHPGRHLFPAPDFHLTAVDADPELVAWLRVNGDADEVRQGLAGELDLADAAFDVVLYRLVLHHIAYQGPIAPCFGEAARLLRPGGALVAIEPGAWHPVGAGLTLANRARLGIHVHGTPDDVPLSPRELIRCARAAGLHPELHAVSYVWRRLPTWLQRALWPLDRLGSRSRLAPFGHTLILIARRTSGPRDHPASNIAAR